jgi:hypothetical protein
VNTNNFLRSFWSIFLISLAIPTLAAPTLQDILLRHQQASGTAASRADKSAHEIVYDINAGGLEGTLTTYEASGHRSRSEIRLGPLAITTATDGKTSWEQDGDGHVRILNGEELTENKADAGFSLDSVDPFKKKNVERMTLRPKRDPETGDYVLDVQPTPRPISSKSQLFARAASSAPSVSSPIERNLVSPSRVICRFSRVGFR